MKNFNILLAAIALCLFSCNRDIKNSIQQKDQKTQTNQVPQILEEDVETLDYNDVEALEAPSLLERKTEAISTSNNIHTIPAPQENRESYQEIEENTFKMVNASPLSTFSIDVDKASYSNVRRMINNGQEVPKDAVKIEEFINYFDYDYPQPNGVDPFSINTEVAQSPWNKDTKLVKIGLQGKEVPLDDIPPSNLVFLIDVSGSMNSTNKLPLLKSAFKLMVNQLRNEDKISIVTYAGAAGLALEPTSDKNKILEALNNLNAGGSTAGGQGIKLAYKIAEENFIKKGNNRVILATDGDFNVGASSDQAMEDLIVEKRESGVFLTCLGFGTGNYQDSKMETLADKGNGNHAYIDTMQEAQRVLGTEFGGTLYTIAKDVKIQVEFNPAKVQAYRLIGYENRLLNAEDFNDDKKDAGELGSGHTVTALYEIIPVGVKSEWLKDIDDLKYSDKKVKGNAEDLLTVKFRYKKPDGDKSKLITKVVKDEDIQLKNASTKTGLPMAIVSDNGSDIKNGVKQFKEFSPNTVHIYDLKHKVAILIKKILESNEQWSEFKKFANYLVKKLQNTSLAGYRPPAQRKKARYMNIEQLVKWGEQIVIKKELLDTKENKTDDEIKLQILLKDILNFKDDIKAWSEMVTVFSTIENFMNIHNLQHDSYEKLCELHGNKLNSLETKQAKLLSSQLLEFIKEQQKVCKDDIRLLHSSQILESLFGKLKFLEKEQSRSSFTSLLLSMGAMVSKTTESVVKKAMETVSNLNIEQWRKEHIGLTVQAQRMELYGL